MLEAELPCASKDGEEYLHPQRKRKKNTGDKLPRLEKAKSPKQLQSGMGSPSGFPISVRREGRVWKGYCYCYYPLILPMT